MAQALCFVDGENRWFCRRRVHAPFVPWYDFQVQTQSITNGARSINQGQLWYGISGDMINEETKPGIRVVTTINGGHMDLSGGDQYALDNDNFLREAICALSTTLNMMRTQPTTSFTSSISRVPAGSPSMGEIDAPVLEIDGTLHSQAEVDAEFGAGRGGIRVAHRLVLCQVLATTATTATFSGPTRIFGTWASCVPIIRAV